MSFLPTKIIFAPFSSILGEMPQVAYRLFPVPFTGKTLILRRFRPVKFIESEGRNASDWARSDMRGELYGCSIFFMDES